MALLLVCTLLSASLIGCVRPGAENNPLFPGGQGGPGGAGGNAGSTMTTSGITDNGNSAPVEVDTSEHDYVFSSAEGDSYTYTDADTGETATVTVTCASGTAGAYTVENNTITFSGLTEESVYTLSGVFYGNIVVLGSGEDRLELQFSGMTLSSHDACPIVALGCDEVTISAKKETENYICDLRDAIAADAEDYAAAVFCDCDLDIQGKGTLYVVSESNNGIHTKGDLSVKNLTLQVECEDNALKGNDSVTVSSGNLTLIARTGDGIKTTNSDISSKGNQRGTVSLTGGDVLIYAACDGIDAAYDVILDESNTTLQLRIFTDKYSPYSEQITAKEENVIYIRNTSTAYTYSLRFYNGGEEGVWANSAASQTKNGYTYYPISVPQGYANLQLFIYTPAQSQGQADDYYACSQGMTLNQSYDTIAISSRSGSLRLSWTNYATSQSGPGGMNGGNSDKGDYSTKGIKAANRILISGGAVTIRSYDDALHANADTALENGASPLGQIDITGGTPVLCSNDDGIHADNKVSISGGEISVLGSYEGIEGGTVEMSGGTVSVVATNDGINATNTSGTGIAVSGGCLYVLSGGDGLDANSRTSYSGILFSGGRCVVISTGNADSAIDTEAGYAYTGGTVVALCQSGGMSSESTHCSNFSSVGFSATKSLQSGSYLVLSDVVAIRLPVAINALVVCLGHTAATLSTTDTVNCTPDANGVAWLSD